MDYQGILVHDYDVTFYNYGADYQECFAHVLRYLKDSIDNKPESGEDSGFEKISGYAGNRSSRRSR